METTLSQPDLNLLTALDVLLAEGNVARAAQRLRLSPSAMSRTLARLRATTGDPLLVRAGRALVPTPHALALRELVGPLVEQAHSVLRPAAAIDLATLERSFTLRTSDGFLENFGPALLARVEMAAPGVRLCFMQKADKESRGLRDGTIDLESGVVGDATSPELKMQALFRDRFICVVRPGHPLAKGKLTAARYAGGRHVLMSRSGRKAGAVDEALQRLGLERRVTAVVGGFGAALALARGSDLVATVPERHTGNLREGMVSLPLPLDVPGMTVSLLWHPRLQADQAHRWLRELIREVCGPELAAPARKA